MFLARVLLKSSQAKSMFLKKAKCNIRALGKSLWTPTWSLYFYIYIFNNRNLFNDLSFVCFKIFILNQCCILCNSLKDNVLNSRFQNVFYLYQCWSHRNSMKSYIKAHGIFKSPWQPCIKVPWKVITIYLKTMDIIFKTHGNYLSSKLTAIICKKNLWKIISFHHGNSGCPRIEDEVEELQHWCGRKVAWGEEGMSQGALRHSKWEWESKERESVVIGEISSLE